MAVKKTKTAQKKRKVKVGKLVLTRESVKDLGGSERRRIKGGIIGLMKIEVGRLPKG